MQAIRTLRAQSRPASPGPQLEGNNNMPSGNGANGGKPATEDAQLPQRPTSAMSRIQGLTPFHKRVVFTPPPSPKPTPAVAAPSAIVQDGTYLNTLGLKLNEAATRVLVATPGGSGADVWKGKKPLQSGRGKQFASLVETELDASQLNTNLRHAILRLLPRSLHMIVSNLSAQVSVLTAVPGYTPSSVTSPVHPSTLHALALAGFAGEILETFALYKLGAASTDLAAIQGHLDNIVGRVTNPLFVAYGSEMAGLLEPLGQWSTSSGLPITASPAPLGKPGKPHPAVVMLGQYLPYFAKALKRCVIPSSQGTQDALAKFLISTLWQALVQLSHRTPRPSSTALISTTNTSTNSTFGSGSTLGAVAHKASNISIALSQISQISLTPPSSPPNAAGSGKKQLKLTPPSSPPAGKKKLALTSESPKDSPKSGKKGLADSPRMGGMLRLGRVPSRGSNGSRSSSLEGRAAATAAFQTPAQQQQAQQQSLLQQQAAQVSAAWLGALATDTRLIGEMLIGPEMPRPVPGSLAREAVEEGFERFVAFREWIAAGASAAATTASNLSTPGASSANRNGNGTLQTLMDSTPEGVPLLILLPVLLGQAWLARPQSQLTPATGDKDVDSTSVYPGVAKLIGYESDETYRRGVLCGFRRAEECEVAIARCLSGRLGAPASGSSSSSSSSSAAGSGLGSGNGNGNAWAEGVAGWLAQRAQ